MEPKRILFVCTGNSCRSVMAQGLLQHRLKQLQHRLKRPVEVESAGLFALGGMPPSRDTLTMLQRDGIDMSSHMAQSVTQDMVRAADLILVMEWMHMEELVRRHPEAKGNVKLLKAFGVPDGQSIGDPVIVDPIGKPPEVYEACYATIRDAVERVAQAIVEETI